MSVRMRGESDSEDGLEEEEDDSQQGYDSDNSEASMGVLEDTGASNQGTCWTVIEASTIRHLQV